MFAGVNIDPFERNSVDDGANFISSKSGIGHLDQYRCQKSDFVFPMSAMLVVRFDMGEKDVILSEKFYVSSNV